MNTENSTENTTETTGYWADDGECPLHFPEASDRDEAAQLYVEGGDWNVVERTAYIEVHTWPATDPEDREQHSIAVEPKPPACTEGHEHDWCSPHEVVGGLVENPGVWGHAGGVVIHEVCRHCGCYRKQDTWATNPSNGQPCEVTSYDEADERSLAWVEEQS